MTSHKKKELETPLTFLLNGIVLMALLALTVGLSFLRLGPFHTVIGLVIAAIKAGLVALLFMNLRLSKPMTRVFAVAGLLWLSFMIGLSLTDYMTRGDHLIPGNPATMHYDNAPF